VAREVEAGAAGPLIELLIIAVLRCAEILSWDGETDNCKLAQSKLLQLSNLRSFKLSFLGLLEDLGMIYHGA
jgi:hypothetical protein